MSLVTGLAIGALVMVAASAGMVALRKLAKEVLSAYETDDGELTPAQLAAIRKAIPQGRATSVKSSLVQQP